MKTKHFVHLRLLDQDGLFRWYVSFSLFGSCSCLCGMSGCCSRRLGLEAFCLSLGHESCRGKILSRLHNVTTCQIIPPFTDQPYPQRYPWRAWHPPLPIFSALCAARERCALFVAVLNDAGLTNDSEHTMISLCCPPERPSSGRALQATVPSPVTS